MTTSITSLLRPDLRSRSPYGAPQIEVPVRLNTNEIPHPLPTDVAEAVAESLASTVTDLNRYPDRDAVELRRELAAYIGHRMTPRRVWAANGSNEVLQQLLQAFGGPGRSAVGFAPSYSMHPILAGATGTQWHDEPRAADFTLSSARITDAIRRWQPDVVFLCSPNNPTGTVLDVQTIVDAVEAFSGLVIVDEAYAEFARDDFVSAVTLLDEYPRLVVTRTMSKAFGMAGADPAVVDAVQLVRLPYHLSALTQAAAVAALRHREALLTHVDGIRRRRDDLVTELSQRGLKVAPSDANFVLFGGMSDASAVWRSLVKRGVLVRDVGIPGWLRVTVGTDAETTEFLTELSHVLEEEKNSP